MTEDKSYLGFIPSQMLWDNEVSSEEKILYLYISTLCRERGFCWATNEFFAKQLGRSIRHVQRLIGNLLDRGYLKVEMMASEKGSERRLTIIIQPTRGDTPVIPSPGVGDTPVIPGVTPQSPIINNNTELELPTDVGNLYMQPAQDFEERKTKFRVEVFNVGITRYTRRMLDSFVEHWSQPNDAKKPKMKWEVERRKNGWKTPYRLAQWAKNNYENIQCFLTEAERSIELKKRDFIALLEPHLGTYGREMLNEFYRYWCQPDTEGRLRWQREEFWDLETRLSQWLQRAQKSPPRGASSKDSMPNVSTHRST